VIRVQADHPLPFVSWGDSRQVQVGDWIMAAGNPFGLSSSVTAGIVSARGREIGAGPFDDFFQLDAPINPGNSGGPAFNMAGEVIGVNTAIVSPTGGSVGIGFAIPSEIAQGVVESLVRKGRIDRGWLGVKLQESPGRPGGGVVIVSVDRGSPAAHSTLRAGDLVTAVNGEHVETTHDLVRVVAGADPGSRAVLTVQRQRRAMEVPVTVGKRPADAADVPE
jgi:serine protease Do